MDQGTNKRDDKNKHQRQGIYPEIKEDGKIANADPLP